jgi:hypothetical protein
MRPARSAKVSYRTDWVFFLLLALGLPIKGSWCCFITPARTEREARAATRLFLPPWMQSSRSLPRPPDARSAAKTKDDEGGISNDVELVRYIVGVDQDGLDVTSCALRRAVSPRLPLSSLFHDK